MESELKDLYEKFGKGFAEWWDEKKPIEKKNLLLDLSHDTILLKLPSHNEVKKLLSGSNQKSSRVLFDYNVETLCGPCECKGSCKHYFNSMLLHEVDTWATETKFANLANIKLSTHMKDIDIFPDLYDGALAIVVPTRVENDCRCLVFTDKAPPDVIKEYRAHLANGKLYDASAFYHANNWKSFALSLLVRLFDEYQYMIRRQPAISPLERLLGCKYCHRSCQHQSAKRCKVCIVS
mmetsp:Transcript_567/g.793  ORF Transcript_567/g.793 Transcript_567/m.793 type:complete len:236 (+) Transcript_567:229-936(+)